MRLLFCYVVALLFLGWTVDSEVKLPPKRTTLELDSLPAHSQVISTLDSVYISAIHVDSSKAFFKTESSQEAWVARWQNMLYALGDSLTSHDVQWNQKLRITSRVYFDEQGRIDYYLYSIKETSPGYPGQGLCDSLRTVLKSFVQTYRMDTVIGGKVAQCGPVSLMPPE